VALSPFSISPVAVTNADFDRFTDATGYRTGAEADG
jgi:formylglycine-generating enzyme required for sulfatase activity